MSSAPTAAVGPRSDIPPLDASTGPRSKGDPADAIRFGRDRIAALADEMSQFTDRMMADPAVMSNQQTEADAVRLLPLAADIVPELVAEPTRLSLMSFEAEESTPTPPYVTRLREGGFVVRYSLYFEDGRPFLRARFTGYSRAYFRYRDEDFRTDIARDFTLFLSPSIGGGSRWRIDGYKASSVRYGDRVSA